MTYEPYETLPAQGLSMAETPRRRYAFCDGRTFVRTEQSSRQEYTIMAMRRVAPIFDPPPGTQRVGHIVTLGTDGKPATGDEGVIATLSIDGHEFPVMNPRCDWDYSKTP